MSVNKIRSMGNSVVLALFVFLSVLSLFSDRLLSFVPLSRYYSLSILTALIFYIPALVLKLDDGRKSGAFFRLKRFKFKWLKLTLSAAVTATIGGIALNTLSLGILPEELKRLSLNPIANVNFDDPAAALLALAFVPAVFEELFFRGAYLSAFGREKRPALVFAGAVCFACLHSTPNMFLSTLLAGCIYGTLVYILDSVIPAMLAHLFNNLIICFAYSFQGNIKQAGLQSAVTVGAVILLLVSIYISLREIEKLIKIRPKQAQTVSERLESQKGKAKIIDISFLLLLALWVIKIGLQLGGVWK